MTINIRIGICLLLLLSASRKGDAQDHLHLKWSLLPDLPDTLGVAGPFVGVHRDVLLVAGGANFPKPVWQSDKVWRRDIHACRRISDRHQWMSVGTLPHSVGYGATVSTKNGVVCIGGNDGKETFRDVIRLEWVPESMSIHLTELPALPVASVYAQAALIDEVIYLAGGQTGSKLSTAQSSFWALDLSKEGKSGFVWRSLPPFPGESRAFNIVVAQHNGDERCVYVMSGRTENGGSTKFLQDVYEYSPTKNHWCGRRKMPACRMAGIAFPVSQHEILIAGGADGKLFARSDDLRDNHPGFPKESLIYNAKTNTWRTGPDVPQNHVTTTPVQWGSVTIIASGEIRPRVRTRKVWSVTGK